MRNLSGGAFFRVKLEHLCFSHKFFLISRQILFVVLVVVRTQHRKKLQSCVTRLLFQNWKWLIQLRHIVTTPTKHFTKSIWQRSTIQTFKVDKGNNKRALYLVLLEVCGSACVCLIVWETVKTFCFCFVCNWHFNFNKNQTRNDFLYSFYRNCNSKYNY